MNQCPSCGAENVGEARFCVKCGTPLSPAPPPESWRSSSPLNSSPLSGASDPLNNPPYGTPNPSSGYQPSTPYTPPPPQSNLAPTYGWQQDAPLPGMQPSGRYGLLFTGERREPVMVLIFSLLTCGIYMFYWWYTVGTEIKNALNREDINPSLDIILSLVTCGLYTLYLFYKYPKLMTEMQERVGMPRNDVSTTSLILAIFGLGIVSVLIIQSELNNIWNAASRR